MRREDLRITPVAAGQQETETSQHKTNNDQARTETRPRTLPSNSPLTSTDTFRHPQARRPLAQRPHRRRSTGGRAASHQSPSVRRGDDGRRRHGPNIVAGSRRRPPRRSQPLTQPMGGAARNPIPDTTQISRTYDAAIGGGSSGVAVSLGSHLPNAASIWKSGSSRAASPSHMTSVLVNRASSGGRCRRWVRATAR